MMRKRYHNSIRNILFIEDDPGFYDQLRHEVETGLGKCITYHHSKEDILTRDSIDYRYFDLVVFDYAGKSNDADIMNYLQSVSNVDTFPIILICSVLDREMILRSFSQGIRGCLCRNDSMEDLRDHLLSSLFSDHILISPFVFHYLWNVFPSEYFIKKFAYRLTDRESSIVVMLQSGMSQKKIGEKLAIATGTVNQYLTSIYNKLNVRSKGELMEKLF